MGQGGDRAAGRSGGDDPLRVAREHFGTTEAYIVGGRVRDQLLGRPTVDVDMVVPGGAAEHASAIARRHGLSFVALDPERDIARVVWPGPGPGAAMLDIAAFAGSDLAADLRQRDFTANAMAAPVAVAPAGWAAVLVDPTGGRADLDARCLRMTSPRALADDPLRLLRAVRLAAELGFEIEPGTREAIRRYAPLVRQPAAERVRSELLRLLAAPDAAAHVRLAADLGLLGVLLPELAAVGAGSPDGRGSWALPLGVLARLEILEARLLGAVGGQPAPPPVAGFETRLVSHLADTRLGGVARSVLLRLSGLLHGVGGAHASDIARRLRFSEREAAHLATVVEAHQGPAGGFGPDGPDHRAVYRFFAAADVAGVDAALLALAVADGPGGESTAPAVRRLLVAWFEEHDVRVSPPRLLDGGELMDHLGLPPGPEVGVLLSAVREAQAVGEVGDRAAALALARRLLDAGRGEGR